VGSKVGVLDGFVDAVMVYSVGTGLVSWTVSLVFLGNMITSLP